MRIKNYAGDVAGDGCATVLQHAAVDFRTDLEGREGPFIVGPHGLGR